jgi:hypothetical protein
MVGCDFDSGYRSLHSASDVRGGSLSFWFSNVVRPDNCASFDEYGWEQDSIPDLLDYAKRSFTSSICIGVFEAW